MDETAKYLLKEGYPQIARHYELLVKYGDLTIDETMERLATAEAELERLWRYGSIHTVQGVINQGGPHKEVLERVRLFLWPEPPPSTSDSAPGDIDD